MPGLGGATIRRRIKNIGRQWAAGGAGAFFFFGLCGCMQPFSKDVMAIVERDRTFPVVIEKPRTYIGSVVLWGGIVDEALSAPGETRLLVIQNPLDAKGYPQTDVTYGVFSAFTPRALDPLVYRKGTLVTIAGAIDRVEEEEQGPTKYQRPVLRVIDIRAWGQKAKGVFPVSRKWEIRQEGGGSRSPFEPPPEQKTGP